MDHSTGASGRWLVADGHVHLYECFAAGSFLDAAWRNLARGARSLGLPEGSWDAALLFVDSARQAAFARLAVNPAIDRWRIMPTAEAESLQLVRDDGARLLVIAGYQIATREGLEVLAIATRHRVADGSTMDTTLDRARADGAVAVIPWGFGKWTLRRGRLIRDLILRSRPEDFLLGDNGGRPAIGSRRPPLLELATRRGFRILPGSDPLPFADQASRAGGYGFALSCWQSSLTPAAALRARLRSPRFEPLHFGELTGLWQFGAAQLRMQAHKRFG